MLESENNAHFLNYFECISYTLRAGFVGKQNYKIRDLIILVLLQVNDFKTKIKVNFKICTYYIDESIDIFIYYIDEPIDIFIYHIDAADIY